MDRMNILVTLDKNYIPPLRVLLYSMVRSDPQTHYMVYVAHSSLTDEDFAEIRRGIPEEKCTICSVPVDADVMGDAPVLRRLSKETYYRLLAASFLPQEVDRVLYIDPDVCVIRPLTPFYNMDMRDKLMAGAGHVNRFLKWVNFKRLHIRKNEDYINAGILLMDVSKLRALDNTQDILNYVAHNSRKLLLGDQDVINAYYDGELLSLDARIYNLDEKFYARSQKCGNIDLDWVAQNTLLIHYNGSRKPWRADYDGQLGDYYYTFRDELEALSGVPYEKN